MPGLTFGDTQTPLSFICVEKVFWIFKTFLIPGKYAALDAFFGLDGTIAGGSWKPSDRDTFFFCRVDEFRDRIIAVCLLTPDNTWKNRDIPKRI